MSTRPSAVPGATVGGMVEELAAEALGAFMGAQFTHSSSSAEQS